MIVGVVDTDGTPVIEVPVAGQVRTAIVDTGFNGDLELPSTVQSLVNVRWTGTVRSRLAGGMTIEEDRYIVDFGFDGQVYRAVATFAPGEEVLIGTHLLRHHRVEIDFLARTVQLERVAS